MLNIGTNREMNYNMMSFSLTGDSLDYVYSWPIYESLFRPNASGTVYFKQVKEKTITLNGKIVTDEIRLFSGSHIFMIEKK